MHKEQGEVYDVRSGDTNTSVGKCLLCVQEKSSWYEKGLVLMGAALLGGALGAYGCKSAMQIRPLDLHILWYMEVSNKRRNPLSVD